MYERWFPAPLEEGRTLLLVGWTPDDVADAVVAPRVSRLEPMKQGTLTRQGTVVRHYYYRIAYGFRGCAPPCP